VPSVTLKGRTSDLSPDTKYCDLTILNRRRIRHPKHIHVGEVRAENSGTVLQSLKGNNKDKNALHPQPAVGMFEEHRLHAAIGD
jgi:hypothetical protein